MDEKYEQAVVTFFDILGFAEMVSGGPVGSIVEMLHTLRRSADVDSLGPSTVGQRFKHFSDSFVRTSRLYDAKGDLYGHGILFNECLDVARIQMELVWKGHGLVRGGIAMGGIYETDTEVFGPGLVKAYRLETDIAVYPRVVLDPALLEDYAKTPPLKAFHHTHSQDWEYVRDLLRCGDDGIFYIDYLKVAEKECDEPEYFPRLVRKHKDYVTKGLISKSPPRVHSKYTWLRSYHNVVVKELSDKLQENYGVDPKPLLLDAPNGSSPKT